MHIEAPFTAAEVEALNRFQQQPWFHPFTCPQRGDGKHHSNPVDLGLLRATEQGWICEDCSYTQTWAHAFMADPKTGTVPSHGWRDAD